MFAERCGVIKVFLQTRRSSRKKAERRSLAEEVKDHKKRLWAIYVAIWLMHKTNNNIFLNNWLNSSGKVESFRLVSQSVSRERGESSIVRDARGNQNDSAILA